MIAMWPYPRLIAHRGGGALAPENTLAALRTGLSAGYRAVEFDVMLAADQVPVLMHDENFGRTIAGAGQVAATPSAALVGMDAGSWFGPAFSGERIALYRDALAYCRSQGIWMNVEIKPASGWEQQTGQVTARLTADLLGDGAAGAVLFSSFSMAALRAAQQAAPGIPRGLLVQDLPPDWREQLASVRALSLHIDHARLTRDMAQLVRSAGYAVFCYTVNSVPRARELSGWGVDAICTDRIDLLRPDFFEA